MARCVSYVRCAALAEPCEISGCPLRCSGTSCSGQVGQGGETIRGCNFIAPSTTTGRFIWSCSPLSVLYFPIHASLQVMATLFVNRRSHNPHNSIHPAEIFSSRKFFHFCQIADLSDMFKAWYSRRALAVLLRLRS